MCLHSGARTAAGFSREEKQKKRNMNGGAMGEESPKKLKVIQFAHE